MKDTVYIVVYKWGPDGGSSNDDIVGVFYDLQEAIACLEKKRDTILHESYATSFEECGGVSVKSDYTYCYIYDEGSYKWDSIEIYEYGTEQRDFITIQFECGSETFNERIYLDQIDRTHYEGNWDWWFGAPRDSKFPDLNFEVYGDKDEKGNIIYDTFQINIYGDDGASDPMATTCDYKITQSWIGDKDGFIKHCDYAKG